MSHVRTRLVAALAAGIAAVALLVAPTATAGANAAPADRCRSAGTSARGCLPTYLVDVVVTGAGHVTSTPGVIDCREGGMHRPTVRRDPAPCDDFFTDESSVTLTAEADPGYRFLSWDGDCAGTSLDCHLVVTRALDVTARFVPITHVLDVQVTGSGTVTSDPEDIECRADERVRAARRKNPCAGDFVEASQVTLTAQPDPGQRFAGWSAPVMSRSHGRTPPPEACSGTNPVCTVTMDDDLGVRATFAAATPSPYLLRVGTAGDGAGVVTTGPGGGDCTSLCWYPYDAGTVVTLTATPAAGSAFAGFTGAPCPANPCTLTMAESRYVTARFDLSTPPTPPDTTAPDTLITSTPRFLANDHSQFRFASNEEGSTFQCSMDGGARQDCLSGIDYPCLSPGRHTFQVWATDPAGNTDPTPAARRFRVRGGTGC